MTIREVNALLLIRNGIYGHDCTNLIVMRPSNQSDESSSLFEGLSVSSTFFFFAMFLTSTEHDVKSTKVDIGALH